MMLLLRWIPIVVEFFGTILVWLDAKRINARSPAKGIVLGDAPGYERWYYHRADLGFALLLFGILLQGASLAWERVSSRSLYDPVLVFTAVLAAAAVVQVVVMFVQARYMLRGLKVTRIAATAAKQNANAAAQTVNTLRATERAIVLIESVDATMSTPAHGLESASVVIFTLKNFGQTIANSVEFSGNLAGVGQLPIEKSTPTTIAPQGNNSWITRSIGNVVNDDNIRKINERTATPEYKIVVTYGDSFGRYEYRCEGRYEPALKRFLITASKTN